MSASEDHGRKYLAADGLHLSLAGHHLLFEEVYKHFTKEEIESLVQLPLWRTFNLKDPSSNVAQIQTHQENFKKLRNWTNDCK